MSEPCIVGECLMVMYFYGICPMCASLVYKCTLHDAAECTSCKWGGATTELTKGYSGPS